jgi:hypothetical protein
MDHLSLLGCRGNQGGQLQHSTRQVPAAPACSSRQQQAGLPPAGPDDEAPLTAGPPAAPVPRFVCAICFDDVEEELRVVELPGGWVGAGPAHLARPAAAAHLARCIAPVMA